MVATLKAWPAAMPRRPVWDGFSDKPQARLAVFEPDIGEPLTRPRTTVASHIFDVTFPKVGAAEKIAFDDWFDNELQGGSLRFLWVNPVTNKIGRYKFIGEPSWSGRKPYYVMRCRLMSLPGRVTLTNYSQTTPTSIVIGSGAFTLPALTVSGGEGYGEGALTLPSLLMAASGAVTRKGSAVIMLPSITLAASGKVSVKGNAAFTLPSLTMAAAGKVTRKGSAAITLPGLLVAGAEIGPGTADFTLPSLTMAGAGKVTRKGDAAFTLPALTMAATGKVTVLGSGAATLPALTITATGKVTRQGTAIITLPSLTMAATGKVTRKGSAAITLPALTVTGAGASTVKGDAAFTMPSLAMAGTGKVTVKGDAAFTLPALTMDATGAVGGAADFSINTTGTDGGLGILGVTGADYGVSSFAYEAWVYATDLSNTWNAVVGHGAPAALGLLYVKSDGSVVYYAGGAKASSPAGAITLNTWHHIAAVRVTDATGAMTVYVDGVAVATGTDNNAKTATNLYVGQNQNGGEEFQGYIYRPHIMSSAKYTADFTPDPSYEAEATTLMLVTTDGSSFTDSEGNTVTNYGATHQADVPS